MIYKKSIKEPQTGPPIFIVELNLIRISLIMSKLKLSYVFETWTSKFEDEGRQ